MKNLILIDGKNFFYKAKSSRPLSVDGMNIQFVFSFFRNMATLMKKMKISFEGENQYLICWEGGYNVRLKLSQEGVEKGLIEKVYKGERRERQAIMTEEDVEDSLDEKKQLSLLKNLLEYTCISQLTVLGNEADDVIASCTEQYYDDYEKIVIVSTDKDYYQRLNDKVSIYKHSAANNYFYTFEDYQKEFDLENGEQWIHLGALVGDKGDTIYGIKGFGEKKSLPYIRKYKDYNKVLTHFKDEARLLLMQYGTAGNIRANLENKEHRALKKLPFPKIILNALEQEEVCHLAFKLKSMFLDLKVSIPETTNDNDSLYIAFKDLQFYSLLGDIDLFLNKVNVTSNKMRKLLKIVTGTNMDDKTLLKKGKDKVLVSTKDKSCNLVQGQLF